MIPEKFKKGDTIGLIAPSSPVLKEDLETINNSIMLMESAEFKIKFAPNAISYNLYLLLFVLQLLNIPIYLI